MQPEDVQQLFHSVKSGRDAVSDLLLSVGRWMRAAPAQSGSQDKNDSQASSGSELGAISFQGLGSYDPVRDAWTGFDVTASIDIASIRSDLHLPRNGPEVRLRSMMRGAARPCADMSSEDIAGISSVAVSRASSITLLRTIGPVVRSVIPRMAMSDAVSKAVVAIERLFNVGIRVAASQVQQELSLQVKRNISTVQDAPAALLRPLYGVLLGRMQRSCIAFASVMEQAIIWSRQHAFGINPTSKA